MSSWPLVITGPVPSLSTWVTSLAGASPAGTVSFGLSPKSPVTETPNGVSRTGLGAGSTVGLADGDASGELEAELDGVAVAVALSGTLAHPASKATGRQRRTPRRL